MRLALAGALCALLAGTATASAQGGPPAGAPLLRVFLTCERCDDATKSSVSFARFVATRAESDVDVIVSEATEEEARIWTIEFAGRGDFAGEPRRLSFELPASASIEDIRRRLGRVIRFGLAEFAFRTDAGAHMDVTFDSGQPPGQEAAAAAGSRPKDPWNYWVFRISTSGDRYGERSQSSSYFSGSASASRTTEEWKMRIGVDHAAAQSDDVAGIPSGMGLGGRVDNVHAESERAIVQSGLD